MKSARISISVSPELYDWVKNQARKQKTSVSRYVRGWMEDAIETDEEEEVKPYPIEEVLEEARQARIERKKGLLPTFHTAAELFRDLGI